MLQDMKRVQKNPHRMRRIGQPAVRESVRREQVAEFVVHFGLRHGLPRQQRHAREDGDHADGQEGEPPVLRELGKFPLDPSQDGLAQSGLWPDQKQANREEDPVYVYESHRGFNHIPQGIRAYPPFLRIQTEMLPSQECAGQIPAAPKPCVAQSTIYSPSTLRPGMPCPF